MKILIPVLFLALVGCKVNQKMTGPHILVYKTRADYTNLVPVILSDNKKEIVSYPHPGDVKQGNGYPLPVQLSGGYLLDNRGIGLKVAFLRTTYQEYASLQKVPSIQDLYNNLIDKDPLIELYDCGVRNPGKNQADQINQLVEERKLATTCKRLR